VGLGAMPGIGAATAAFISYGAAQRKSKNPELYGKGSLEGVAAAESGNSGVTGATMIPLLSLGVPGDVITAVMMGAFMYHGLTPGPVLFQNNLVDVYAIFFGVLLSSFLLFFVAKAGIRGFAQIARVPNSVLFPGVLTFCLFGAYLFNNSLFDVLVMIISGVFGYVMRRFGVPMAPVLLAFVLGPLFEDNLRRSLLTSGGSIDIFFRSPICWFFIFCTVMVLAMRLKKLVSSDNWRK
jgi:putative tricarboxylic transport membrane protein